mgnify:CR=1 FL=1
MSMKKLLFVLMVQAVMIISLQAQKVSNYTYKFDNGIIVKAEQCWNHIWVDQRFSPLSPADKASPLSINARAIGELTSGSSFKLLSEGKEIKTQGIKPGTYSMKMTLKLSAKPGTLSFDIDNIVIKADTKTSVGVTIYDYQVMIEETPQSQNGKAYYESKINRFRNHTEQNLKQEIISFYMKGAHDKKLTPGEVMSSTKGRITPGTYDVLVSFTVAGRIQKVWLENFTMKPDVSYKIATNLNGGAVIYNGGNRDVKAIHLYPAGTSARQTGNPSPDKNSEILKYDDPTSENVCPPGTYDILLNIKNGAKYEWKKNLAVNTGSRTDIR